MRAALDCDRFVQSHATPRAPSRHAAGRWASGAALLAACACLTGAPAAQAATARAARSIGLRDTASLRLMSRHGLRLYEKGGAKGNVPGTLYLYLTLASTNRVTAQVSVYPRGGSVTGYGSARYVVRGAYASFSGTLSITRGTGRYRRARGSHLRFSGTVRRVSDAITVSVSGRLSV